MEKIKARLSGWWKGTSLSDKVLIFFGVCGAAFATYYIFVNSYMDFNSDTATANLLAREQMTTGQFFPKTWGYGNEVWFMFFNVLMIPLSLLVKDQFLLRAVSVFLVTALTVFLIWYVFKKLLKSRAYRVFIPIYFMGTSFVTSYTLFGEAAYGFFLMQQLLTILFGISSVDENFKIRKKHFIAFCLIVFYFSMRSFRTLLSVAVPAALGVLMLYLIDNRRMDREASAAAFKRILKWGLLLCGVVVAGFLINKKITAACTVYQGAASFRTVDYAGGTGLFKNISNQLMQVLSIFGYQEGVKVLSKDGVFMLLRMVIAVVLTMVFPVLMTRKYREQSLAMRRYILIVWLLLAVNLALLLFTQMGGENAMRYILVNALFLLTLSACYIYEYMLKGNAPVVRFFVMLCVAAVLMYQPANLFLERIQKNQAVKAANRTLQQELLDRGLTFGYATYWNAHRYSVLYNFEPEIAAISLADYEPDFWLTTSRVYRPDYNEGDTFILFGNAQTPDEEEQARLEEKFGAPKEIFTCRTDTVYVYDYNISERFLYHITDKPRELLGDMAHSENATVRPGGDLLLHRIDVLYGPYLTLEAGTYTLEIEAKSADPFEIWITKNTGQTILQTFTMEETRQSFVFRLDKKTSSVEFVIRNLTDGSITVKSVKLSLAE